MYKSLLFLHIFGVFLIVGGVAIATALGIKASKNVHARTIAAFSGLSIIAERYVITPEPYSRSSRAAFSSIRSATASTRDGSSLHTFSG